MMSVSSLVQVRCHEKKIMYSLDAHGIHVTVLIWTSTRYVLLVSNLAAT